MKRLKKILKWTGIVLGGLVAIGLVANACFIWITDTRLERQLATIRAAGVDPEEIRPDVPTISAETFGRLNRVIKVALDDEFCGFTARRCKAGTLPFICESIIREKARALCQTGGFFPFQKLPAS